MIAPSFRRRPNDVNAKNVVATASTKNDEFSTTIMINLAFDNNVSSAQYNNPNNGTYFVSRCIDHFYKICSDMINSFGDIKVRVGCRSECAFEYSPNGVRNLHLPTE